MTSTTRAHTVKYTPDAYLVRDAAGATVERFPFDADDFHGSRRVAYRAALAHAAELDAAAEAAEVSTEIAAGGEVADTRRAVYLEQGYGTWAIRFCDTNEIDQVEATRTWALEACNDLGYRVAYEVWNTRVPANQMNPAVQAEIDAGRLVVYYKDDPRPEPTPAANEPAPFPPWPQAEVLDTAGSVIYTGSLPRCQGFADGRREYGYTLTVRVISPDDTAPPAVPHSDNDPEPTPPTPAAARVLWTWEGSASVLQAVIAERRQLVAA